MNAGNSRNTTVVSISLEPRTVLRLDALRSSSSQNRSSFIASLVEKEAMQQGWNVLRSKGDRTAKRFKIVSEDDIYKAIGDA